MPVIDESNTLSKSFNTEDYVLNPFHQPNEIYDKITCHGGGDGNNDGVVDVLDKNLADAGTDAFVLDVNGDGLVSTADGDIIQEYIDGIRTILPSWWNFLDSDKKLDWFTKMANIYTVDQKQYIDGDENTRYTSGQFATEFGLRLQGYNKNLLDLLGEIRQDIPDKYSESLELNGKPNIPVYFVNRINRTTNKGHGMNGLLKGNDPLEFNNWVWYDPQINQIIQPGDFSGSIPFNSELGVYKIENFGYSGWGSDMPNSTPETKLLVFLVDSNGDSSNPWNNPNLLTTKPTVAVEDEEHLSLPNSFELNQNYPNPFNPTTTISYSLENDSNVLVNIYDISGKLITTLQNEYKTQGTHSITWNGTDNAGSKVGAGVYIYQLQAGDFTQTKKMVLMK